MINVIGLGYIGLPTALILAANGNEVVGTDISKDVVKKLENKELPFKESGLVELYEKALINNIKFQTKYCTTDIYIVTVPTPYDEETKMVDPRYIIQAVNEILKNCNENTTIVIESTISPGTIKKYIIPLIENSKFNLEKNIFLVHAPERIIPGNMIYELQHNSRTIGAKTSSIGHKVKEIYESFCEGEIICTDIETAEMTKVIENNYRSVNIALANEIVKISRDSGLDPYKVIDICNRHPRVNILQPGPGVGGHCIPVDPWFLVGDYPEISKLTQAALRVNESMVEWTFNKIQKIMKIEGIHDFKKVGIYGLAYKANIGDIRESPTLKLIDKIKFNNIDLPNFYDPMISKIITKNQCTNFSDFLDKSELIVIMVEHSQIIDNQKLLEDKIIFDTKNATDAKYKL